MAWWWRGIVWTVGMIVLTCGASRRVEALNPLGLDNPDDRWERLKEVAQMTSGNLGGTCMTPPLYRVSGVPVSVGRFASPWQKTNLLASVLADLPHPPDHKFVEVLLGSLLRSTERRVRGDEGVGLGVVVAGRILVGIGGGVRGSLTTGTTAYTTNTHPTINTTTLMIKSLEQKPWYIDGRGSRPRNTSRFQEVVGLMGGAGEGKKGWWTYPYFHCASKRWLLSYIAPITRMDSNGDHGFVSIDLDVTSLDVNQCDPEETKKRKNRTALLDDPDLDPTDDDSGTDLLVEEIGDDVDLLLRHYPHYISFFRGTHKCHPSSLCEFQSGHGWSRGGYVCRCRQDYFARTNKTFNGTMVEVAWEGRARGTYEMLYVCHPCPKECPNCTSDQPCTAIYNWPFRIALLTISSLCMVWCFVLMGLVYHYRSVKVFRLASPTFLCICLIGSAIMYLEMAAIFPVLDTYSCVATKWTRHLGFCVTFSSLLMKTWRVSLTYRVTSAHKIKLTDKQLLQWLTPILLIVLVYLGAWSLSATPTTEYIYNSSHLKFKQCKYDWWDHSLAMGEVLFLMWGVKVCFSVRKAESFFDEAKYISWAVYNIAVVNIVMVMFHLLIFPNAGPDIKYLFGFLRTQLSTSTTVLLIFGPKFYRIVQGTGDQYDNRARAKGVTASFSLNGLGVMDDEPADLSQENEELKEEIQKLAAQMEFMKIVHMEMNNRHLKPKPGGYFSEKNSVLAAQSPGTKPTTVIPTTTAATITTATTTAAATIAKVVETVNENSSSARVSSPGGDPASERV